MTVKEALAEVERELAAAGIESPRRNAELLAEHALGLTRASLYGEPERVVDAAEWEALRALVERRRAGEPVQYILGEWGFRRLVLKVDRRALIPRPETEVLVDRCLAVLDGAPQPRVLDVGVGSGAIALAIADEHPGAHVTGIDASPDALALARENLGRLDLDGRVTLLERDLDDGLPGEEWDLVVSNPPYVSAAEVETLADEVRDWEPRAALVDTGQTDALVDAAFDALRPGGWLLLETSWDGAVALARRLRERGYEDVEVTPDLTGRERVVAGRRP